MIFAFVTGKKEPWDASIYWVAAYPAAMIVCTAMGYFYPTNPWMWPLWLFEAQFVAMCVRNGEIGDLWPLGMALSAIISLPAILLPYLSARLRIGHQ